MTTAQVVKTSVTVNNNSPIQDYVHLDDQTQPTFEMTRRLNLSQDVYCYGTLVFLIGTTHFILSEIVFKVIYLFYGPPIVNIVKSRP